MIPHNGPDLDEEPADLSEPCPVCGAPMDWVDCDQCGGEGGFDGETLMEEDPLWYGPDDYERCDLCGGRGGWYQCWNLPHTAG